MPTHLALPFLLVAPWLALPLAPQDDPALKDVEIKDASGRVLARVSESIIGFNDPSMNEESFLASSDGRRVAYMIMDGAGVAVVVDGKKGESFEGFAAGSLVFSPDGKHFGYVGTRPGKHVVVHNGKLHEYSGVSKQGIVFSSDSQHVGWVAEREGRQMAVIDGLESAPYDGIAPQGILFSPEGKRSAYQAKSGDKYLVVLDGEEGRLWDTVAGLRFTEGGHHALYVAMRDGKWYAIIDGVDHGPYDELRSLSPADKGTPDQIVEVFEVSSNGARVAFIAKRDEQWYMVLDGKEQGPFQTCAGLALSPEGSRVAYLATRGEGWFMSVDGVEQTGLSLESLSFSPDGKRLATVVKHGEKRRARVDGVEGKEYDKIDAPGIRFSYDGKRTAYLAELGGERLVVVDGVEGPRFKRLGKTALGFAPGSARAMYSYRRGEKEVLVIDGVEGPACQSYRSLSFAPDGSRYAYAAELEKDTWVVVVDGVIHGPGGPWTNGKGRTYHKLGKRTPNMSADGKRVAWVGVQEEGWKVVVDGLESPTYDIVQRSALEFSPDGRHVSYCAQRQGKKMIVVDGIEIDKGWDGFRPQDSIVWQDDKHFSIRASKNPRYLLVEVTLP
ncbi:MAG: hypothetical protein ABL998_01620 [Planctomycetota bacterium]